MIGQRIATLSLRQISGLLGPLKELIVPDMEGPTEQERLDALIEHLVGETTWDARIQKALDTNDGPFQALRIAIMASGDGASLSDTTSKGLLDSWLATTTDCKRRLEKIEDRLEHVSQEATEAHQLGEELRSSLPKPQDFPDSIPESMPALERVQSIAGRLQTDAQDVEELVDLANEELEAVHATLNSLADDAWSRLRAQLDPNPGALSPQERRLFLALPKLVLNRQLELLKHIANPDQDLDTIALPDEEVESLENRRGRLRARRRAIVEPAGPAGPMAGVRVCALAQHLIDTAEPTEDRVVTSEDFAKLGREIRRHMDPKKRRDLWLGAARSIEEEKYRTPATGEGLLCEGEHRLLNEDLINAPKLLNDAYSLLCAHTETSDAAQRTAKAMSLVAAYRVLSTLEGDELFKGRIEELLEDDGKLKEALLSGTAITDVATLWARVGVDQMGSQAAANFLATMCTVLGDYSRLFRHCLEELLHPSNLHKNLEQSLQRLRGLFSAGKIELGTAVHSLLHDLEQDFGPQLKPQDLTGHQRRKLRRLIERFREELAKLTLDDLGPLAAVRELLPDVLGNLADDGESVAQLDEPNLSLSLLVETLYLRDRNEDIDVPVAVRNAENAAPASNISISLQFDGEKRQVHRPTIRRKTRALGGLKTGQETEVVFSMSFPPGVENEITEVPFQLQARSSEHVLSTKKAIIKIRPETRAKHTSPYLPGVAVAGESFVGRHRELERIVGSLVGDFDRRAILLCGIRRIGKTSLAHVVGDNREVKQRYFTGIWSVDKPKSYTTVQFFIDLSKQLLELLPEDQRGKIRLDRKAIREEPYAAFENLAKQIELLKPKKRLLLMIDEFDHLIELVQLTEEREQRDGAVLQPIDALQPQIFGAIRKVVMNNEVIRFLVVGLPAIQKTQKYESRLYGLFERIEVNAFSEDEAREVIDADTTGIVSVPKRSRAKILHATGRQPYLLQLLCNELFNRMKHSGRDIVSEYDIQEVIAEKLLPNESNFSDYISLLGDDRPVLYGLALAERDLPYGRRHFVRTQEVADALLEKGIEIDVLDIQTVLDRLRADAEDGGKDRPLVRRASNSRDRFQLVIGLLGEHLIQSGPGAIL